MRLLILVIVTFTQTLNCLAQETFVSKDVTLILPKGVHKQDTKKLSTSSEEVTTSAINKFTAPHIYEIGNILIGLHNVSDSPINTDNQRQKNFVDDLYKFLQRNGNNTYTSQIITINSNQVLLVSYHLDQKVHHKFYCVNPNKTLVLAGKVQFDENDKEK